jgi:hypothetical protein
MIQYNPTVSGSLIIAGTIQASQGITGSFSGSIAGLPADTSAFSASLSTRITNNESTSSAFVAASGSLSTRVTAAEATSSAYVAASESLSGRITSNEAKTGSYATTGSNIFIGTQIFTGSLYVTSDLIVQGSSSLQNITASAVSIGTNTVILNTDSPILRFGGVSVQDSGSSNGRSGSLFWDSLNDHWIYVVPSGSTEGYNSAILMSGPKNTGSLGSEVGLTTNYIPVAQGEDHITNSIIFQSGSTNIGIGTTNPSGTYGKLSVAGGISILNDNNAKLEIGRYSSETPNSYIKIGANSNSLRFTNNTDTADLLYLTNSGSLGIGTTPSTYTLDVNGTGRFSDRLTAIDNANVNAIWSVSNSVNGVGIQLDNSSRSSGGRFGILVGNVSNGTFSIKDETNNATRFQISSSGVATFSNSIIAGSGIDGNGYLLKATDGSTFRVIDPTSTGGISTVNIGAIGTTTGNVRIHATDVLFLSNSGNSERMRVTSEGKVGIGTTSPSSLFHIEKSSNNGGGASFPRINVVNSLATQGDGSTSYNFADIRLSAGNGAVDMYMTTTYAAGTWAPAGIINVSTNHDLQFKTNNTERMRLTNGGNISLSGGSGSSQYQTSSPINIRFDNAYSSGYTDASLKLYLFNSGNTRQGFTSGPAYDLQYHTSGDANGRHAFYANNTEVMRINGSGHLILPYQPAFYAYAGAGGPSTRTTGAFTGLNLTRVNRGSHYNTSNGRFTAPIAGVYEFVFSMLWRNDSGDTGAGEISIGVNGSNVNSRGIAYSSSPSTVGYHAQTNVHVTLSLSAGDYVTGWVHFSGNTVGNWYYGDNLASFSGKLLG